jgi:RNA polymerase-binding transcription factor DksA
MGMSHADPLDHASDLAQVQRDEAWKAHQRIVKPEQTQNADGSWPITLCVDCGSPIEPARLNMARVRCLECQTVLEKRRRR